MSATFASFNSALSALRYNQVLMDTASGNIANVSTEGYARRRAVGEAMGAPAVPAMWSRYEGSGDGVRVGGLDRMVDPFLDARARREHGNQSYLDTRAGHPGAGRGRPRRARRQRCRRRPRRTSARAGTTSPTTRTPTPRAARCCPARASLADADRAPSRRNVEQRGERPALPRC